MKLWKIWTLSWNALCMNLSIRRDISLFLYRSTETIASHDSQANKTIEDEVSWSFISFFDTRNMVALTVRVLSIEFKLYFNHSSKLSLTTFVNTFIVSTSFSHWDFDGLFDRSQVVSRIYRHHMLFWILIFWKAGASCLRIESNLSWFIMINRMQSVVVHHIFTYFFF